MLRFSLLALALLASALVAGFFYAYQWSVMPGLAATEPAAAIAAMQGINRVVRTAAFAFSFFGTLVFGALAAVAFALGRRGAVALLLCAGTVIYGAGAVAITFVYNVPLNEQLATVTPTAETAPVIWRDYIEPWTRWNLVRTLASIVTFLVFAGAAISARR